jgi:hypothetical protein
MEMATAERPKSSAMPFNRAVILLMPPQLTDPDWKINLLVGSVYMREKGAISESDGGW